MRKKGSLELSINAIVIVVLAMTLLGLGVIFIKSQMHQISKMSDATINQLKEQVLDDLRRSDKKISMQTDFQLPIGSMGTLPFGVKNMRDRTLHFKIEIVDLNDNAGNCTHNPEHLYKSEKKAMGKDCAAFFWNPNGVLEPSETKVFYPKIFAPEKASTYMYQIKIVDENNNEYTSKTFYVTTTS